MRFVSDPQDRMLEFYQYSQGFNQKIEIDSLIRETHFLKIFLHSSVYLTKNNIQTTNNCDKI